MVPNKFTNADDHHPSCARKFLVQYAYNTKANSWSHAPLAEKGLGEVKAKNLECYSGTTEEPNPEVKNIGRFPLGEIRRRAKKVWRRFQSQQMKTGEDDKASNEGESSKIVEIDASTGEEILSRGAKMEDIDPDSTLKNNEMLKPPEDAEQREQHQTLTERKSRKKWHKDAHDAVIATINTHAQGKEHQEKNKILDEDQARAGAWKNEHTDMKESDSANRTSFE